MRFLKHSIVTALAGVIFFFVGEIIFSMILNGKSSILLISLYFLVFMVLESILLFILSQFTGSYDKAVKKKKNSGQIFRRIVILLIVLIPVACLLEFLYELGGDDKPLEATSYVFIIDDSGSMEESDPRNTRATSTYDIMNGLDSSLPYAVYLFSDLCSEAKEMSEEIVEELDLRSSGGTNMVGALRLVADEYDSASDEWGTSPKVILLTDGYPSSTWGLSRVLNRYRRLGIVVSTVGFGEANDALLQSVADSTGGAFVHADDISLLPQSMKNALLSYSDCERNLLSDRFVRNDSLYTFLRIIFLIVLSVLISLIKAYATYNSEDMIIYFVFSLVLGILASFGMEIMISHWYLNLKMVHLICCVLWAILPATIEKAKPRAVYKPIDFDEFQNESENDSDSTNRIDQSEEDDDGSFRNISF